MDKVKKILVLGGTGFIGSEIVVRLLEVGQYRLTVLSHRKKISIDDKSVEIIYGSLQNFDLSWIDQDPPDFIIHSARLSGGSALGRLLAAVKGNKANKRLMKKLEKLKRKPRIIYISGTLMYGNRNDSVVTETCPLNPTSYAKQYIIAENPWLKNTEKLEVTLVRPPWILGADSWFKYYFLRVIDENKFIPCYGKGENWLSIIHVKDCARKVISLLQYPKLASTYNIFACRAIKQTEFCQILKEEFSLPIQNIYRKDRFCSRVAYEALTTSCNLSSNYFSDNFSKNDSLDYVRGIVKDL